MSTGPRWQGWAGRAAAIGLMAGLYGAARLPQLPAAERARLAGHFRFSRFELTAPARDHPGQSVRSVHPSLRGISAWISAVGASVALADLDQDGLPNDVCYVDPRYDAVTVAPVPGGGTSARYAAFDLDPGPLVRSAAGVAPMGCLPVDLDEDGRLDLVVYYWGRPPLAFLRSDTAAKPGPEEFRVAEIVAGGGRWYTNAVTAADVDGDGHLDLLIGNYFADGARILDAAAPPEPAEQMQDSMSRADNGGRNRLLRCRPAASERFRCEDVEGWAPEPALRGWTLALGAADLDDDLLPEVYVANDFGPDRLLHNRSRRGQPRFGLLHGRKGLTVPNSKVLGRDSFKGMGVDFGDVDGDAALDIYVSNIAADYSLHESHFLFVRDGDPSEMSRGTAPFRDRSEPLGLSRGGWGWDARLVDFDNDGRLEALQARGFIQGEVDRWPELQELAMGNDTLLRHPQSWPQFQAGADLSGQQPNGFFARDGRGVFFDLASDVIGLGRPEVTRGVATGDVDGDGDMDFVVANQWQPSAFYRNDGSFDRLFLGLRLCLPPSDAPAARTSVHRGTLPLRCRPAVGAAVRLRRGPGAAEGAASIAHVDGGNGHSGKRSPEVHFGFGPTERGPHDVQVRWRDGRGVVHTDDLRLEAGWHTVILGGWPAGGI